MREERTRGERREMYGRDKLKGGRMRKTRRDAGKRTLRARDEKIAETCDDEHQSKEGGVDLPKPKYQKTESATRESMKLSVGAGRNIPMKMTGTQLNILR
jgi:hypothetical protein